MCGLTGVLTSSNKSAHVLTEWGDAMSGALWHRGPDDGGIWTDPASGIMLGSRRLAIRDLSAAGHMPMTSRCGRFVIAYNGEIYNFIDIRRDLEKEGRVFFSNSDTEVLLEACAVWGVEDALSRMNGMFSFALWDKKQRTLQLARDRVGIKPLYYGWCKDSFLFGSELKALHACPAFDQKLDRNSLRLFLRFGYIPGPYTIYQHIYKLQPGHILTVSASRMGESTRPYWDVKDMVAMAIKNRFAGNFQEASDLLEMLLRDSVRLRMVADVPVGAFLSGGIDSSLVVAMMKAQASSSVRTFTIGFLEDTCNEAHYAQEIASLLGTEHTDLYISHKDAYGLIPSLPQSYDEPLADVSQIPTFLVSRLARQSVTVSLSGDGGDELFGGYSEYVLGPQRLRMLRYMPPFVRSLVRGGVKGIEFLAPRQFRKIAELLRVTTAEGMHRFHASQWMWPEELVQDAIEYSTAFSKPHMNIEALNDVERMMYVDLVTYLQEDILTKLDRASMAVSLEAREPLLDYRVVEFAWQLPLAFKIKQGQGKRILRSILAKYIPTKVFERPKMGFDPPIAQWLRGPLRPWAEELLDPLKLRHEGLFNPLPVREAWSEHLKGTRNRATELWCILMFQAWQQEWM